MWTTPDEIWAVIRPRLSTWPPARGHRLLGFSDSLLSDHTGKITDLLGRHISSARQQRSGSEPQRFGPADPGSDGFKVALANPGRLWLDALAA